MADDVRNACLAASRSRTGSREMVDISSRRFSQVKATFNTDPTHISQERSYVRSRSRQESLSPTGTSPPRYYFLIIFQTSYGIIRSSVVELTQARNYVVTAFIATYIVTSFSV